MGGDVLVGAGSIATNQGVSGDFSVRPTGPMCVLCRDSDNNVVL